MNKLLLSVLAVCIGLGMGQAAFAVCELNGNTPEGGNVIDCPAPVQNTALNPGSMPPTTFFADNITIPPGGGIDSPAQAPIVASAGDDVITTSGLIRSANSVGILSGDDNDTIEVNGGRIEADTTAIQSGDGEDTIVVNDGEIIGGSRAISSGDDNDTVILNGGTYSVGGSPSVFLGRGDDTLTFGGNIDLGGITNCADGFDTLVFAMEVPEKFIPKVTASILAAGLPDGSVAINGVLYEWENCERLVPELRGPEMRPIPTLSEWGMIAMAGLIGIVGFIAVRKKYKVTA